MNIIELAKQAGIDGQPGWPNTQWITRFAQIVIEAHTQELIGIGVEPCDYQYVFEHVQKEPFYTADQLAAAVLRERERCAKVCESEYDNWDNERPLRICATAIRKGGSDANG